MNPDTVHLLVEIFGLLAVWVRLEHRLTRMETTIEWLEQGKTRNSRKRPYENE